MDNLSIEDLLELYHQYKYSYIELIKCREKLLPLLNFAGIDRQQLNSIINILSNVENEFSRKIDTVRLAASLINDNDSIEVID